MDNRQEKPYEIFIPENYKTKSNVFGFEVKISNLMEGIIFAIIPIIIGIFILPKYTPISDETNLSLTTAFSFTAGLIGFIGIDDELIFTWLLDIVKFKKNQRIAYYNPRVKKEAHSIFEENNNQGTLPRDRVIKLYENYKNQLDSKNHALAHEQEKQFGDGTAMYFEDDIGFINKPLEYMNKKERKKHDLEERRKLKSYGKQKK